MNLNRRRVVNVVASSNATVYPAAVPYRMMWTAVSASVIVSDLQGGNERGDELMENLLLRPVMAAADHEVGDLLPRFC